MIAAIRYGLMTTTYAIKWGHGELNELWVSTAVSKCMRSILFLLIAFSVSLLSFTSDLKAQRAYVGAGFGSFGGRGEGIQSFGCTGLSSESGYAIWGGYDVVGRAVALQGTVRVHREDRVGPSCGIPAPIQPDGTFIFRERRNLLQYGFVGTDLRVRVAAPEWKVRPSIAVGAGQAWREGHNVPYGLMSAGVRFPVMFGFRAGVEGTFYQARVRFDDVQRTYENSFLISEVPLGSVREWRTVRSATVFLELPIGRADSRF